MKDVVVTTGLRELQVVQSSSQNITTNKPTSSFLQVKSEKLIGRQIGRMSYLSPNQQCENTEGKNITYHGLAYPKLTWESSNLVSDH